MSHYRPSPIPLSNKFIAKRTLNRQCLTTLFCSEKKRAPSAVRRSSQIWFNFLWFDKQDEQWEKPLAIHSNGFDVYVIAPSTSPHRTRTAMRVFNQKFKNRRMYKSSRCSPESENIQSSHEFSEKLLFYSENHKVYAVLYYEMSVITSQYGVGTTFIRQKLNSDNFNWLTLIYIRLYCLKTLYQMPISGRGMWMNSIRRRLYHCPIKELFWWLWRYGCNRFI